MMNDMCGIDDLVLSGFLEEGAICFIGLSPMLGDYALSGLCITKP